MSRVAKWNPMKFDKEFGALTLGMLRDAAEVVADNARNRCPVGTISRPAYKTGPYSGESWTERRPGALKRSVRVVEKHDQYGAPLSDGRNVRVYVGNRDAYYARIVEYSHPTAKGFMRKSLAASTAAIRAIIMGKGKAA